MTFANTFTEPMAIPEGRANSRDFTIRAQFNEPDGPSTICVVVNLFGSAQSVSLDDFSLTWLP